VARPILVYGTCGAMARVNKYYQAGDRTVELAESSHLYVVRTKSGVHPYEILSKCLTVSQSNSERIVDDFPEANVWVYRSYPEDKVSIADVKEQVRALNHSDLDYIGSVWVDPDTRRYQLYTGNLFIQLRDNYAEQEARQFLERRGLTIKLALGFANNTYFVEPANDSLLDAFEWASQLNEETAVKICQPELIVKRKSFDRGGGGFVADPDRYWISNNINLPAAWRYSRGAGVRIAIIDDGIDYDHPAFGGARIVAARDMLKPENKHAGHLFGSEYHGTACASVASSSDRRAPGMAPESELVVVRCKGLGSVLEAEAIYWAVEQRADIISCSWGPSDGEIDDPSDDFPSHRMPNHTRLALEFAATQGRSGKGCLIFFAAGNGNEDVSLDSYASNPNVLAIAAVNKDNQLTGYSDSGFPVFCVFPSSEISRVRNGYTTRYGVTVADRLGTPGYTDEDYFSLFGGTSASAPGAAGVAGLALSIAPELTAAQLKNILRRSCVKIGRTQDYDQKGYSEKFGWGLLDAQQVVANTRNFMSRNGGINIMNKSAKGYALHIGVDKTDPSVYDNFPMLSGCVNDARALMKITQTEQFDSIELLADQDAKRNTIIGKISGLARHALAGDLVVLSYAGHGSFVTDTSGDEAKDEVLVTYDGLLIDDEIYDLFLKFKAGVRLVWIADCCHSKSNTRAATGRNPDREVRKLDSKIANAVYEANREDFQRILRGLKRNGRQDAAAAVWNMYACQEDEFAEELNGRGLFTQKIESLYETGQSLGVEEATRELSKPLTQDQNPEVEFFGDNPELFDHGVFKVHGLSSETPVSEVVEEWDAQTVHPEERTVEQAKFIVVGTDQETIEINDSLRGAQQTVSQLRIIDSELQLEDDDTSNGWDRAYDLYDKLQSTKGIDFLEPDTISRIYSIGDESALNNRSEFLEKYPNPIHPNYDFLENPFIWHLADRYSQLRSAFNEIRKEFVGGEPNETQRQAFPLICHIDTGIMSNHPALPKFYDAIKSRSFTRLGSKQDATDTNSPISIVEQQGHGQGTISILAGDKVNLSETGNQFTGYYGAFPFARVMSLKISESVVLLSGSKFARALRYAVDQGADVVTMSMAGAPSRSMVKAINYAYDNGVVVVSAAGNSWTKGGKKLLPKKTMYPARLNRVIGVTGATLDHTPYLIEANEDWERRSRSPGGSTMQTCYGPASANRTNIAAYTPNVQWASPLTDGTWFDKSGGGTSSATPQVAAAAAMWLYKHRESLAEIKGWRRAELTRQALFQSAVGSDKLEYDEVFGRGMLKAQECLMLTPASLAAGLKKENKDSIGWFAIDDIFKQLTGRGNTETEQSLLSDMIQTELAQLNYLDPLFYDFDEHSSLQDMAEAINESDQASNYLKAFARSYASAKMSDNQRGDGVAGGDAWVTSTVETDSNGKYRLSAEGCGYQLIKKRGAKLDEAVFAEYELKVIPSANRSAGTARIGVSLASDAPVSPAMIVELDEESGIEHIQWIIPDSAAADKRSSRGIGVDQNTFYLEMDITGLRGRGRIKKFFLRIYKTIQDQSLSERPGLIAGRIGNDGFEWVDRDKKIDAAIKAQTKTMLLLHGTFSSAEVGFSDLLARPDFFHTLEQKRYGDYVLAYNMSTIRSSVQDNAEELRNDLQRMGIAVSKLTVIGHSRGCLVARAAFAHQIRQNTMKMVLVAGTHLGTPMASARYIGAMINRASNLAVLAFGPTVLTGFLRGVSSIVRIILGAPGISDQAPDSELIRQLAESPLDSKQLLIGGDFEPDARMLKQLGDQALDVAVFGSLASDGVTPLHSALASNEGQYHHPYYRDPLDQINHFGFFADDGVIGEIEKHI